MQIKLAYLKTGEYIVTKLYQVTEGENKKLVCYVFDEPKSVLTNSDWGDEPGKQLRVQAALISWPAFTKDKRIEVFPDNIVCVSEPTDELIKLYEESINE
jgi:hypothetical protein